MAMRDYGAMVKKNGVIITKKNGGLFQNYTDLKYVCEFDEINNPDGTCELKEKDTNIDETLVQRYSFKAGYDENGKYRSVVEGLHPEKISMAGNYMALIGDKDFMIGFYKDSYVLVYDGIMANVEEVAKQHGEDESTYNWFNTHKKQKVYHLDKVGDFVVKRITKRTDDNVFLAKFEYKGDKYEVLYGYGVDPDWDFMCDPKRSYWSNCWRWDWHLYGKKDILKKVYRKKKKLSPVIKAVRKWVNYNKEEK